MTTRKQREPAQFDPKAPTVVVIAGAAARGPYEAGVLAHVLPSLFPHGLGNVVLLGTSAGAINAALWAARLTSDRSVAQAGEQVKDVWRSIDQSAVFEINSALGMLSRLFLRATLEVGRGSPELAAKLLAAQSKLFATTFRWLDAAEQHGERLSERVKALLGLSEHSTPSDISVLEDVLGFLDTTPLQATARKHLDIDALYDNVDQGRLRGVGVVATSCPMDGSGGRSRVFLYGPQLPKLATADGSSIDYVQLKRGDLAHAHVLASAAIPIAFAPVPVPGPAGYEGFYTDGGVRLNTPIRPALDLDVDQLVVVSSLATAYPTVASTSADQPDILDVGAQAIHTVLGDGTIEDLRNLQRMNEVIRQANEQNVQLISGEGATAKPYRRVKVLTVSPPNGAFSGKAQVALEEAKREGLDYLLLSAALHSAGVGVGQNELASFLLFHRTFVAMQFRQADLDVNKLSPLQRSFVY